jgi:hypothetical protein
MGGPKGADTKLLKETFPSSELPEKAYLTIELTAYLDRAGPKKGTESAGLFQVTCAAQHSCEFALFYFSVSFLLKEEVRRKKRTVVRIVQGMCTPRYIGLGQQFGGFFLT